MWARFWAAFDRLKLLPLSRAIARARRITSSARPGLVLRNANPSAVSANDNAYGFPVASAAFTMPSALAIASLEEPAVASANTRLDQVMVWVSRPRASWPPHHSAHRSAWPVARYAVPI